MSTAHNCTSGFTVPGVGYRTFFVSGKELPEAIPLPANKAPDESHGYDINPTRVSLKVANIKCVPSEEDQIASGVSNISSKKQQ